MAKAVERSTYSLAVSLTCRDTGLGVYLGRSFNVPWQIRDTSTYLCGTENTVNGER